MYNLHGSCLQEPISCSKAPLLWPYQAIRNIQFYIFWIPVHKQCKNLTEHEAPENGGLVCHWFHEENSQHCGARCNQGYDFPSRVNDYATCSIGTGFIWSFQTENENATFPSCIRKLVNIFLIVTVIKLKLVLLHMYIFFIIEKSNFS